MRHLRFLIIAIATICVLALGAFALVSRPLGPPPADDDIIIKGGSLEVDCGKNHGTDCFGDHTPGKTKPKHKDINKHVMKVVVTDNANVTLYTGVFDKDHQPAITITYK